MAKKKDKKPKGKRIKVTKAQKKSRASKKRKARKGRKGRGQYSSFFPTNRQIDSNQYWQLRAEIAGAEARVRSSLKDRQNEEGKAEKRAEEKVGRLEQQVQAFVATPPVPQPAPNITVGQPNITVKQPNITVGTPYPLGQSPAQNAVTGGEYNSPEDASADRDNVSDEHQIDLTAEQTPTRAPAPAPARSPVSHRGETFEEGQQRQQQQLRDARKIRQQSKLRNLGNIVSRWKSVSDTAKAREELRRENEPRTAHNLHVTSSEVNTPTRATVESVVTTGAPPASAAKQTAKKKRQRGQFLSGVAVSPVRPGPGYTTPESLLQVSRAARSARDEAAAARGALFAGETFSQETRAAADARDAQRPEDTTPRDV